MNIGVGIKEVREKFELTQVEVCNRAGLTQGFYSSVETGVNKPSLDTLDKIAMALGVPVFVIVWLSTNERDIPKKHRIWYNFYHGQISEIIDEIKTK
jgi:transcriptional regulator with XRE-family HTH domain